MLHATAFKSTTRPTRSNSMVNNLHDKKEGKKTSLKVIHDYVLLPRNLDFTVLCYIELLGRSQSI